jgi:hypothetical protein
MKQRALEDPTLAPYTRAVLGRIDPDVLASLTEHQFRSIRDAIDLSRPIKRHTIDLRGVVPLGFARWYFVVLAGRDRRGGTRVEEALLLQRLKSALGTLLFVAVVMIPVTVLLVLFGYALKSFLGVDIISDAHLIDMIR